MASIDHTHQGTQDLRVQLDEVLLVLGELEGYFELHLRIF